MKFKTGTLLENILRFRSTFRENEHLLSERPLFRVKKYTHSTSCFIHVRSVSSNQDTPHHCVRVVSNFSILNWLDKVMHFFIQTLKSIRKLYSGTLSMSKKISYTLLYPSVLIKAGRSTITTTKVTYTNINKTQQITYQSIFKRKTFSINFH